MGRKPVIKKVVTKGSVVPQVKNTKKEIDPNEKWLQMKADFDLEDDEMPAHLAAEIANWNSRPKPIAGLTKGKPNKPLNHILQAEATLKSLAYPLTPQVVKVCKLESCKELFRTPYESVAYCSDFCRMTGLAGYGIQWIEDQYSTKNEIELWMGQVPPALIPESVLAVMKYLVLDSESKRDDPIIAWSPKSQKPEPVVAKPIEPEAPRIEPEIPAPIESTLPRLSIQERLSKLRAKTALDKAVQRGRDSNQAIPVDISS